MANDLANLPISMLAPQAAAAPPSVPAAMALQQALSTSQSPQSTEGPQPITTTPEWQSVMQAGQGSFGVPGFDAQGQPTPEEGIKGKLKRALSDAIFAIGQGFSQGPAGIAEAATPGGREYIHQQRALEAEAARSAQLQQTGMALGRLYGGIGGMQRGAAAVQHQQTYAAIAPALIGKMQAQASELNTKAGAEIYKVTPIGLFNSKTGDFVPGASYNQPVTVTPDLKQQFPTLSGFPDGEVLTPSIMAGIYRSMVWSNMPVQTGGGVASYNRITGKVGPPQAPPAAWARPVEIPGPGGVPFTTTAGQAIKSGAPTTTSAQAMKMAGTAGSLGDLDFQTQRLTGFIGKGTFDNLSPAQRAIIAKAMDQPDGATRQAMLSYILPHLTDDQVQAVGSMANFVASIGTMRGLLGNSPMRTEKQWTKFVDEIPTAAELLSGSRVAKLKMKTFEDSYNALKGPISNMLSRYGFNRPAAPGAKAVESVTKSQGKPVFDKSGVLIGHTLDGKTMIPVR